MREQIVSGYRNESWWLISVFQNSEISMAFDRSFCSAQWEQIMIAARHWVKKKYLRQGLKLIRLFGQQVSRTTRVVIPAINPPHYWVSLVSSRHFQITDHHPAVSIHYRFTAGLRELKGRFRNKWFFFGGGGGGSRSLFNHLYQVVVRGLFSPSTPYLLNSRRRVLTLHYTETAA